MEEDIKDIYGLHFNRSPVKEINNVLLVDGSINIRNAVSSVLRGNGLNVIILSTANRGMKVVEEQDVDCIILGQAVQGMKSIEVISLLRSFYDFAELPIYVAIPEYALENATAKEEFIVSAITEGANEVIRPYNGQTILDAFKKYAKKKKKK